MGKRTHPFGLRSNYLQRSNADIYTPFDRHLLFPQHKNELAQAFIQFSLKWDLSVLWVSTHFRGFFWEAHVFYMGTKPPIFSALCRKTLSSSFWGLLRVRYHNVGDWFCTSYKRKYAIKASLGTVKRNRGFKRFRANRFFFKTAAFMHLGISALSPDIISRVICSILHKHNKRHWLVFRFIDTVFGYYMYRVPLLGGFKFKISGKINGRRRKRKRVLALGPMPLQGFANQIRYSYRVAITKFGVFGIKLWILIGKPVYRTPTLKKSALVYLPDSLKRPSARPVKVYKR